MLLDIQKVKYDLNRELEGKFLAALFRNDVDSMRRFARPLLNSIKRFRPQPCISDEKTIQLWKDRSELMIQWGRGHGY